MASELCRPPNTSLRSARHSWVSPASRQSLSLRLRRDRVGVARAGGAHRGWLPRGSEGRRRLLQGVHAAQLPSAWQFSGHGVTIAYARSCTAVVLRAHKQARVPTCTRNPSSTMQLSDDYIWALGSAEWPRLLRASLACVVCVACNLSSSILAGSLFQSLVRQQPFSRYRLLLLGMMVGYIVEPMLSQVYIRSACAAGEAIQARLRSTAFDILLEQRMDFYDRHRASELTALLCRDLDTIRASLFTNVSRDRGLRAALEACGSVAVLCALSWRLGPILALVILSSAAAAFFYRARARSIERCAAQAATRMADTADEAFGNIQSVRVFAGEREEARIFGLHVETARQAGLAFAQARAFLESLNRSATHVSLLALYALGGWLVTQGLAEPGVMVSTIGFTWSLVYATQGLLQTSIDLRTMTAALRRVQSVLGEQPRDDIFDDEEEEIRSEAEHVSFDNGASRKTDAHLSSTGLRTNRVNSTRLLSDSEAMRLFEQGDIVFKDICFSYPSRPNVPVLRGLNLRIPAGKVTALVGASGAGKSTIALLLQRLYSPQSGSLTIGDVPFSCFLRRQWTRGVTSVAQEPRLFSRSIADNIAFGLDSATPERIQAAASAAHAHSFISALPQGYDTPCGETGGQLSGGQRQRIALARALLRDTPVLLLDEATSALDAESEAAVQRALTELTAQKTVLIVAHRLSTVQAADQILVMDKGTVAEAGTHAQLLRRNGVYARLVATQTTVFADV